MSHKNFLCNPFVWYSLSTESPSVGHSTIISCLIYWPSTGSEVFHFRPVQTFKGASSKYFHDTSIFLDDIKNVKFSHLFYYLVYLENSATLKQYHCFFQQFLFIFFCTSPMTPFIHIMTHIMVYQNERSRMLHFS